MLSYRLINEASLGGRSYCVHCKKNIAFYDLIPVLSWLALKGSCRSCHQPISALYPFIELLTTIIFTCLYFYIPAEYWISYTVFFSALIITIRSDLEYMLISSFATLFLIPIGIMLSAKNMLPISATESIIGAIAGYTFFWVIAKVFSYLTSKQGIGKGDLYLLAFIGSFTGLFGCWISVLIGSVTASCAGICYLLQKKFFSLTATNTDTDTDADTGINSESISFGIIKIPFGPFLALGALLFVFLQRPLFFYLLAL